MKKRRIRNNDAKSRAAIKDAGWVVLRERDVMADVPRFVAVKAINEDDDSTTHRYESSYTLEGLAKQVVRREREEAR